MFPEIPEPSQYWQLVGHLLLDDWYLCRIGCLSKVIGHKLAELPLQGIGRLLYRGRILKLHPVASDHIDPILPGLTDWALQVFCQDLGVHILQCTSQICDIIIFHGVGVHCRSSHTSVDIEILTGFH